MARGRRGARGAPAARPVNWGRGHAPAPVQTPPQLTVEPTAKGPPPSPPAVTSDLVPVSEPTSPSLRLCLSPSLSFSVSVFLSDQFCGLDPCEKTRWKDVTVLTQSFFHVIDG